MVRQTDGVCGMNSDIAKDLKIGKQSKVWSFCVIEDDVVIGNNTVIGAQCYIGAGTRIGDNVRIQTGVFLPRGTIVEDNVFIGPHVVATDDKYPVAGNRNYVPEPPIFANHCSIGAGAVILPGIIIGAYAMVGAGAVVSHDVKKGMLVTGIPAREMYQINNAVQ